MANSTTVCFSANLSVSSGGTANNTVVHAAGDLSVSSGGTANYTTLNGGGDFRRTANLYIFSNGIANSTTVNSYGNLSVSSGGTANYTTLNGGYGGAANLYIFSDGTANSTTINYSGNLSVSSGGTANSTTVNDGGNLSVSIGGIANSTTVNSSGYLSVSSGGTANSTVVNSGGSLSVSSGGTASYIIFDPWKTGSIVSETGATVTSSYDTLVYWGNAERGVISKGKILQGLTITPSESLIMFEGGALSDTIIEAGGSVSISNRMQADSTTVNRSGNLNIASGGTALSIVENGGYVSVDDGASATFAVNSFSGLILSNGSATIHSGTTANSTMVNFGGNLYVSRGGMANSTTVNSSGSLYVASDGTANSTVVNASGNLSVSSGGTALSIMENGGYVSVDDGASATFAANSFSGLNLSAGSATVHSGTTANGTTIDRNGYLYVYSRGTANYTTLNGDFYGAANLYIFNDGMANSTTVNSSGWLYVSSGGTANSTTVNSRGNLSVSSGGTANSTTVNSSGYLSVSSGGTANSTVVNSGGSLSVSSGGTASYIIFDPWKTGSIVSETGATVTSSYDTLVYWGNAKSGVISKGKILQGLTITPSGSLVMVEGGALSDTIIEDWGSVSISNRMQTDSTTVNLGNLNIASGGIANSTTVNSGGRLYVFSGGTALSIVENGGYVSVDDGASATFAANSFSGLVLSYGSATLHSGTTANNTTVEGRLYVCGGTANSTMVNYGGNLYIFSDGTANSTTVNYSGNLFVSSGGTANNTTINYSGNLYVSGGGTANSTVVNSGGNLSVSSGGTANSTAVNSNGRLYVSSGGTANSTTVNSYGNLHISSGGVANSTTVNCSCNLYVSSGGTANSTVVNSEGRLSVSSGGTASYIIVDPWKTGSIVSKTGATVTSSYDTLVYWGNAESGVISKGKILQGLTITPSESLVMFEGGALSNTIIESGGSVSISNRMQADSTTVNRSGNLNIASGGTALSIVENGGYVSVDDGASATFAANSFSGLILSYGSATLHSGTTANSTTVNYHGNLHVSSGGVANSTTISGWYNLSVSSGGTANSTTVNSSGYLSVASGGTANSTVVNSGGSLSVSSGGTASYIIVDPWKTGSIVSETGATVTSSYDTLVYWGNAERGVISKGKILQGLTATSSGALIMFEGGALSDTIIEAGGSVSISNRMQTDNTTVNRSGKLDVASGGTANSTVVNEGGSLSVSGGGIVNSTTVNSSGYLYIYSGMANSTTVATSGNVYISGGTANNTTVATSGNVYISGGGIVNSTTVTTSGNLFVCSGGTANNTTVATSGNVYISGGGTANSTTVAATGSLFVCSGGTANSTMVSTSGNVYISSGGIMNSAAAISGGSIFVSSGGTINDIHVSSGGVLFVSGGGTAENIVWTPCIGRIYQGNGASVTFVSQYSGCYWGSSQQLLSSAAAMKNKNIAASGDMCIMDGGSAGDISMCSGGYLWIGTGGRLNNLSGTGGTFRNDGEITGILHLSGGMEVTGSGRFYLNSATEIASGVMGQTRDQKLIGASTFTGFAAAQDWHVNEKLLLKEVTVLSGGSLTLFKGASATVVDNAGYLDVHAKATVRALTAESGAKVLVNGGLVASATFNNGASIEIYSRGSSYRTSCGGSMYIANGGKASITSIDNNGILTMETGAQINSTTLSCATLQMNGGTAFITSGHDVTQIIAANAIATSNTLNGGSQQVGGQAVSNNLWKASQVVLSGGMVSATQISFANQTLHAMASATENNISTGSQLLGANARAKQNTIDGGDQILQAGALAEQNVIVSGNQTIGSGASAVNNTLSSGSQVVFSGGFAVSNTLSIGSQIINGGASVLSTTVFSGGRQYVSSGGIAKDTTILRGGSGYVSAVGSALIVNVSSGGSCMIDYDAYAEDVTVADGGAITVSGTVKNLTLGQYITKNLYLGTAIFQGKLDCYLNPDELEDLSTILLFSELESLTLRVRASQYGQGDYSVFSTEDNEDVEYIFMLVLNDGKAITLVDQTHYWYNGECFTLVFQPEEEKYYLKRATQEKTKVLITSAGNIDILEDSKNKVTWTYDAWQNNGEVTAVQETGGQTVYLNTSITLKGLLQDATAIQFTNGGMLQYGANPLTIQVYSTDEAEAIVYGVHNAAAIQRRLPSAPAVPSTAVMNISAAASNGSAWAAGYYTDGKDMVFSGGIAGKMDIGAAGQNAQARGIYAGGRISITEPVNNVMQVTADASSDNAYALGISRVSADEFDFDWTITAKSAKKNAEAYGAAAYAIDQFTKKAKLTVTADAAKNAIACGFFHDKNETVEGYKDLKVAEIFAGTLTVQATGETAYATGIEQCLILGCNMESVINVSADGSEKAEAFGAAAGTVNEFTKDASLTVTATSEKDACAYGFFLNKGDTRSLNASKGFAGVLTVQATGETAYAAGVEQKLVGSMTGRITVSATGTETAEAHGACSVNNSDVVGRIEVTAKSKLSDAVAYGWSGDGNSLSGSLTVSAQSTSSSAAVCGWTGKSSGFSGSLTVSAQSTSSSAVAHGCTGAVNLLSGSVTVSAKGVTEVKAFGFAADEFTPAKGGSVATVSSTGTVFIRAESTNQDNPHKSPVYAIAGRVDTSVDGSVCAMAFAADPVQETHAAAVYGATLSVSGIAAASAATRAVAVTANDESSTLNLTVSGVLFAGNQNVTNAELVSMLKNRSQYAGTLKKAKENCLHPYAVYAYDGDDTVTVNAGGAVYGDLEFAAGANTFTISNGAYCCGNLSADDGTLAVQFVLDTKLGTDAVMSCSAAGAFAEKTTSVSINVDKIISNGCYKLAEGIGSAKDVLQEITLKYGDTETIMTVGSTTYVTLDQHGKYRCYFDQQDLYLEVTDLPGPKPSDTPQNLKGSQNGISWDPVSGAESYVAGYTTDGFESSFQVSVKKNQLDTFNLPAETYQWRARIHGSVKWSETASITASGSGEEPVTVKSVANNVSDVFFAYGKGTWESKYAAKHVGVDSWTGTGEYVKFTGKNKITDVFEGSADANLLVLTDDENGDALFVDDVYSAFPADPQARIAQLDEIRAGAGDDVVDMTSQKFTYDGDGLIIRGGAGNDVIWSNKGDNMLFGDSGNDRIVGASGNDVIAGGAGNDSMHGGGGKDIFCFCKDWGTDTVEQLSTGTVTLWFTAQTGTWDETNLIYTDGANSVKVTGVTADKVTLKFGDDASGQYKLIAAAGTFMDATSEKIFEDDENKGIIASL